MGKKFVGLDGLKHFWTKAKSWITAQITSEVTAKIAELVANAPEDLNTLKEIADWIKNHANDASAMNTQINTNKNNIAALQTSVAEKAAASHTHDDRYFTEIEVTNKLAGKSDTGHTHTKSEITDFPTSLPVDGGNADTVDNYHVSESATGNTVVARNSSGYIYATYFNQTSSIEDKLNVANIFFDQGDGYLRKKSIGSFISLLGIGNPVVFIPCAEIGYFRYYSRILFAIGDVVFFMQKFTNRYYWDNNEACAFDKKYAPKAGAKVYLMCVSEVDSTKAYAEAHYGYARVYFEGLPQGKNATIIGFWGIGKGDITGV